ncbi:sensor protein FixL [archaeon BMS3Abin16]|nr:sensor protein FixL [archaeon BMS3Abin16]HDY74103.1 PAS domain S-box protein [Euryarchaeota archaeon]
MKRISDGLGGGSKGSGRSDGDKRLSDDGDVDFKELVESSPECICRLDLSGCIVYMNPAGMNVHKQRVEDVFGRSTAELSMPEYASVIDGALKKACSGETVVFENRSSARGSWHETTFTPIKDGEGKVTGILSISRDITKLKQAEEEVHLLQRVDQMINAGNGLDEVFKTIASGLRTMFGYDSVAIHLLDPEKHELEIMAYSADESDRLGLEKLVGFSVLGYHVPLYTGSLLYEVVEGRKSVITEDIPWILKSYTDKAEFQRLAGAAAKITKARWGMGVPMLAGDEVVGVIGCGSKTALSDTDAERLASFGAQAVIAIKKQQHFEELRVSEEKYRSLFDNMRNGFAYHQILVDKENRPVDYLFLEVNDAFEEYTGLKREDIIGKQVTEVIPGVVDSEPNLIEIYGRVALQGGETRFDFFFKPFNRWYSVSVYSPEKGFFVTLFEDISERKQMEERIIKSQEFLNSIVENSGDAIITTDADSRVTLWSRGAENLYGYKADEVLGKNIDFLYPSELKEERRNWQKAILAGETVRNIRTQIYNSNRELVNINLTLSPLIDRDGKPAGSIGVSKNITDIMEAEKKLREKIDELEKWQRLTVGRELRMAELKSELKELKKRLGE